MMIITRVGMRRRIHSTLVYHLLLHQGRGSIIDNDTRSRILHLCSSLLLCMLLLHGLILATGALPVELLLLLHAKLGLWLLWLPAAAIVPVDHLILSNLLPG